MKKQLAHVQLAKLYPAGSADLTPIPKKSEITNLNPLAHLKQALGKLLNKIHLNAEINRQIGVLMSRINRPADIEVDVGGFLKQQTRNKRSAVPLEAPVLVAFVVFKIIPQ